MPYLKKIFLRYADYASATLQNIFTADLLSHSTHFKAENMKSTVFMNDGKGNFTGSPLPVEGQIFPVNAVLASDFDADRKMYLILAGNDYSTEVESGRNDAGIGLFLRQDDPLKFLTEPVAKCGLYNPGDVKCLKFIKINNKVCILAGKNKGAIQVISYSQTA